MIDARNLATRYRHLSVASAAVAAIGAYVFAVAGRNISPLLYRGLYTALVPAGLALWAYGRQNRFTRLDEVRGRWGREAEERKRDTVQASRLFQLAGALPGASGSPGSERH